MSDLSKILSPATYQEIMDWAWTNRFQPVTRTLLEIWASDDPTRMKNLAESGQLIPLLKRYQMNLDSAQDLRAEQMYQATATFELLQMSEIPLKLPRATSASPTS